MADIAELKTYKMRTKIGSLGEQAADWFTKEDWKEHRAYVERCRQDGTLGKEVEWELKLMHNPMLDESNIGKVKSTMEFTIIDFSNGKI